MIPLFPYPYVHAGEQCDGSVLSRPVECVECPSHVCEAQTTIGEAGICRFGFHYQRLADDILVIGLVMRGTTPTTPANRRMIRKYAHDSISSAALHNLQTAVARQRQAVEEFVMKQLEEELKLGRADDRLPARLIKDLQPHIQNSAGQLHDYLDLCGVILKQLNVFIVSNYPDISMPENVDDAPDELQSIYWAARLMEEKVAGFGFFLEPTTITAQTGSFSIHRAVTKYRKMYQRSYEAKQVQMSVEGCWTQVEGNPEALTIIPHALIDNAVKYAPRGSRIGIGFEEWGSKVTLRVSSFGPRIEEAELSEIFKPYYRGRAAVASGEEGMGFGLAFAEVVAEAHQQRIEVRQDVSRTYGGEYWTEFSCGFTKGVRDVEADSGSR